jgi:hypothetical protein
LSFHYNYNKIRKKTRKTQQNNRLEDELKSARIFLKIRGVLRGADVFLYFKIHEYMNTEDWRPLLAVGVFPYFFLSGEKYGNTPLHFYAENRNQPYYQLSKSKLWQK